jgi:hypothetical protein
MKILFFPKYNKQGPSSRYRIYQYLDYYNSPGNYIKVQPLFGTYFFSKNRFTKIIFTLFYYIRRFVSILNVKKYDLVYIEYELFPYFPSIFEKLFKRLNVKYIVDYDDAIFHNYNNSNFIFVKFFLSNKIDTVIINANYVITGSPYLTKYVISLNTNCIEIPTSISKNFYKLKSRSNKNAIFIIGWIGSKTTSVNVLKLIPAFEILKNKINYQLNLIGFDLSESKKMANLNVKFIEWDSNTEIDEIRKFDLGIMPLEETSFNQGKCGFKLIQYIGSCLPTISTPLEANVKINRNKKNLHATYTEEWVAAFEEVFNNQSYYK